MKKMIFAVSLMVVIVCTVIVLNVTASDKKDSSENHLKTYIVSPGDTLWDIALNNKGETDVRTYVYKIRKINDLESSELSIGMRIKLP